MESEEQRSEKPVAKPATDSDDDRIQAWVDTCRHSSDDNSGSTVDSSVAQSLVDFANETEMATFGAFSVPLEVGETSSSRFERLERYDFSVVSRRFWLTQPPMKDLETFQEPVPFVVICHTATYDESSTGAMIQLVKRIQEFHIQARGWDDIAYNFLIGGDGNVYEGRGFNHIGHHTHNHKKRAISIAIAGCYIDSLPSREILELCKKLIGKGVEDKHIAQDYKLVGHCQITNTLSPGRTLFEEIKTWPHWTDINSGSESSMNSALKQLFVNQEGSSSQQQSSNSVSNLQSNDLVQPVEPSETKSANDALNRVLDELEVKASKELGRFKRRLVNLGLKWF